MKRRDTIVHVRAVGPRIPRPRLFVVFVALLEQQLLEARGSGIVARDEHNTTGPKADKRFPWRKLHTRDECTSSVEHIVD